MIYVTTMYLFGICICLSVDLHIFSVDLYLFFVDLKLVFVNMQLSSTNMHVLIVAMQLLFVGFSVTTALGQSDASGQTDHSVGPV